MVETKETLTSRQIVFIDTEGDRQIKGLASQHTDCGPTRITIQEICSRDPDIQYLRGYSEVKDIISLYQNIINGRLQHDRIVIILTQEAIREMKKCIHPYIIAELQDFRVTFFPLDENIRDLLDRISFSGKHRSRFTITQRTGSF